MAVALPLPRIDIDRVLQPAPRVRREGADVVISLRGEQDLNTAGRLAAVLAAAAAESDGDLVVDLSQVEFMDAKIVVVLVRRRDALRTQSRDLILRAPSPFARRILQLCGLLRLVQPAPAAADEIDSGAIVGGDVPMSQVPEDGGAWIGRVPAVGPGVQALVEVRGESLVVLGQTPERVAE